MEQIQQSQDENMWSILMKINLVLCFVSVYWCKEMYNSKQSDKSILLAEGNKMYWQKMPQSLLGEFLGLLPSTSETPNSCSGDFWCQLDSCESLQCRKWTGEERAQCPVGLRHHTHQHSSIWVWSRTSLVQWNRIFWGNLRQSHQPLFFFTLF